MMKLIPEGEDRVVRVKVFEDTTVLLDVRTRTGDGGHMVTYLTAEDAAALADALTALPPPAPLAVGDVVYAPPPSSSIQYDRVVVEITDQHVITRDSDDGNLMAYTHEDAAASRAEYLKRTAGP